MRLTVLSFLFASAALLAPAAHAQFGSSIVYDPTQSAHALQQIQKGENQFQKWATELQSLASLLKRAAEAKLLSTTQCFGNNTKPLLAMGCFTTLSSVPCCAAAWAAFRRYSLDRQKPTRPSRR